MIDISLQMHRKELVDTLLFIYKDVDLTSALGFKGGTACYLLYGLDRFSIDLDFNLLQAEKADLIYKKLKKFLESRSEINEEKIKSNTIFFLYNYKLAERNIKIEISTRDYGDKFELLPYLGISIMTMRKEYMFAHKLVALTDRKRTASRDLFEINFFFNNRWDFVHEIIEKRTGQSVRNYFEYLLRFIPENFPDNKLLHGLGELISEEQKSEVKNNLKNSVLQHIQVYLELHK